MSTSSLAEHISQFVPPVSANRLAEPPWDISVRNRLLTRAWAAVVAELETAIRRFSINRPMTNSCDVVFFEIAGDKRLHVNVTHMFPTRKVRGWAGPAVLPRGYVHNRTFGAMAAAQISHHIRDMVCAVRI